MNPFDGINPDFTIFGAEFTELWQKILAGVWGIAIVISAIFLIIAITKTLGTANNPNERADSRRGIVWSGISIAALLSVAVIYVAIASLVGQ